MRKIVTEKERKRMRKEFRDLINAIQIFQQFPRKQRLMLAERLLDIAVAEEEGKTPPEFPPEGFEIVLTKITGMSGEEIAATLRSDLRSGDNHLVEPPIREEPKVEVPIEDKL